MAKLSCIRPAQEQSSKLWSAEIQMHLRGARKFGQITFSAMADNQKRDPDEACWKHSLVPILRKIKAQNSGPEESQELHEHSGQLPVRQQSHITIGSRSMLVVKTLSCSDSAVRGNRMQVRGPQKFMPITFSATTANHEREPEDA